MTVRPSTKLPKLQTGGATVKQPAASSEPNPAPAPSVARTVSSLKDVFTDNPRSRVTQAENRSPSSAPETPAALQGVDLALRDAKNRDVLVAIGLGLYTFGSRDAFDELTSSPSFRNLDTAIQTRTLEALRFDAIGGPAASLRGIRAVVENPEFARASPTDKAKLLDIGAFGNAAALSTLGSSLLAPDEKGTRMFDSLHRLAKGTLHGELVKDRGTLLASTLQEVADSGTIRQGNRGTCAATAVAIRLAAEKPAEYARLVAGLASPYGKVQVRDGHAITRVSGTERADGSTRSITQRLVGPAFMEFANGKNVYNNARDRHVLATFGFELNGGLHSDEQARLATAVLGTEYERTDLRQRGVHVRLLESLGKAGEACRRFLAERTGKEVWASRADLFQTLQADGAAGSLTSLKWDDGGHAVVFQKIENGRAYYLNPHGNSGLSIGKQTGPDNPPPRRAENRGNLQSMSVEDYRGLLLSVSKPKSSSQLER